MALPSALARDNADLARCSNDCRRVARVRDRETEAGRHRERVLAGLGQRLAHGVAETLGDLPRGLGLLEPVEEHGELVTSHPRHGVAGTHGLRQHAGDSPEHLVAGGTAERVVDLFHPVGDGEDDRHAELPVRQGDAQTLVECRLPGQPREYVEDGVRARTHADGSRISRPKATSVRTSPPGPTSATAVTSIGTAVPDAVRMPSSPRQVR